MKKIFYIIALGIALAGCSNNEDELLSTGSFPEDHVIRVITEVNEPLSRAGYDAMNLERFGLMIRNSENAAYNYHKQMVGSGSAWSTSDGQQMLWDAERTPVTMIAYAPFMSEATPDASLTVNALTNQSTEENVKSSDFLLMKATVDPEQDLTADGKLKIISFCKKQPMRVEDYILKKVEFYTIRKEVFEENYLEPGDQYLQLRYVPAWIK